MYTYGEIAELVMKEDRDIDEFKPYDQIATHWLNDFEDHLIIALSVYEQCFGTGTDEHDRLQFLLNTVEDMNPTLVDRLTDLIKLEALDGLL